MTKSKSPAKNRTRKQRMSALTQKLAPQPDWRTCRYTVQVSHIDPCDACWELHTNSKTKALKQWRAWASRKHRTGGEWMVYLFEHPTDRPPTRKALRKDPRGWIYHADYPRSKCLRRHDYMMEDIQDR